MHVVFLCMKKDRKRERGGRGSRGEDRRKLSFKIYPRMERKSTKRIQISYSRQTNKTGCVYDDMKQIIFLAGVDAALRPDNLRLG